MSGNDAHFRRLERMYLSAPNNDYYRPEVDIAEGSVHNFSDTISENVRCNS